MTFALLVMGGPLAAFAAAALLPPLRRAGKPAAYLTIAGSVVSLAAAIALLRTSPYEASALWAPLGAAGAIRFGILVDALSASMATLVALIALLVQVYSLAYMAEESRPALGRYFAYHALFAFAMQGLVLAHNLLQTYFFWELVGLGSYLLIGFYWEKPEAGRAALKAFWTTRIGDVGFALGLLSIWTAAGTFTFSELFAGTAAGTVALAPLALGLAGVYLGAMGKSAQFPLHVWLPDAMEGPTPVSALIHAATMVAAGVYLMVRVSPLLVHAPALSTTILAIGVLTALVAGSLALIERDLKRVLAYSTVSQLGMMMAAVGAGAPEAAYFHLLTHAFFKALLFLAAGSILHAIHTGDLFSMGRLARKMPVTAACFAVGALALAGVPPLSGFFSKDEILSSVLAAGHPLAFVLLLLNTGLTAFYVGRAFFLAMGGDRDAGGHPHESPALMTGPMIVLAVGAVAGGILGGAVPRTSEAAHPPLAVALAGTLAALFGLGLAWRGYQRRSFDPGRIRAAAGPLVTVLERRYFLDDLFVFAYRRVYLGVSAAVGWVDRYVLDGAVNALAWATWQGAGRLRALQSGRAQDALYALVVGVILLAWLALSR
ncbi:MAG TPA: NADH-quinone oxidoreductase subunit L [Candidatus Polarisedimenticolaceae bacterium]|nr:NADH-quinone oxidoreductase subunit L [Candidatus Polarisedimenticolaceae bacterium]